MVDEEERTVGFEYPAGFRQQVADVLKRAKVVQRVQAQHLVEGPGGKGQAAAIAQRAAKGLGAGGVRRVEIEAEQVSLAGGRQRLECLA